MNGARQTRAIVFELFSLYIFGLTTKGAHTSGSRWHKRATEGLRGRIKPERCCRCQDKALEQTKHDDACACQNHAFLFPLLFFFGMGAVLTQRIKISAVSAGGLGQLGVGLAQMLR